MSWEVERALLALQVEHTGEHLPMESILGVLHDEEYAPPSFFRNVDGPRLGAWMGSYLPPLYRR